MGNKVLRLPRAKTRLSPTVPGRQVVMPSAPFVMDSAEATPRGTGANAFTQRNPLAAYKFATNDITLGLDIVSDGGTGVVGVLVNGAWHTTASVATDSILRTVNVSLPAGAKVVEIWAGLGSSGQGTYLEAIRGDITPIVEYPTRRLAVYGDSISSGYNGTINERDGYASLMRLDYPGRISVEAFGGRTLTGDPLGARANIAQRLTNMLFNASVRDVWLAIGTNDWGFDSSAASFQTAYGELLTEIRSRNGSATIYAQTPIVRSGEAVANAAGSTLPNFRTAIATAASGRPGVTVVDGAAILLLADLADGTHPTTAGFVKYKAAVKTAIGY